MKIMSTYDIHKASEYLAAVAWQASDIKKKKELAQITDVVEAIEALLTAAIKSRTICFWVRRSDYNQYLVSGDRMLKLLSFNDCNSESDEADRLIMGAKPFTDVINVGKVVIEHEHLIDWVNRAHPELITQSALQLLLGLAIPDSERNDTKELSEQELLNLEKAKYCANKYPDECIGTRKYYTADDTADCVHNHSGHLFESDEQLIPKRRLSRLISNNRKKVFPSKFPKVP